MDITYKKVGDYYYHELELPSKYKYFRLDKYGRKCPNSFQKFRHYSLNLIIINAFF